MTAQIRGTNQAGRNISDAIALVQALMVLQRNFFNHQRMRELAVQGATNLFY